MYKVTKYIDKYKKENGILHIANLLKEFINYSVIDFVQQYKQEYSEIVLLSASPISYIRPIANDFGYKGYGSYIYNNEFIYLYGVNKIKFLNSLFPAYKYDYYMAISDNTSDVGLLKLFKYQYLIDDKNNIYELK